MEIRITPSPLRGSIRALPSKSYAQRIIIASALADGPTFIHMSPISGDIGACLRAVESMGAAVRGVEGGVCVEPAPCDPGLHPVIDCGESATAARILLPVAAALYDGAVITGSGSLTRRSFGALRDALAGHGCDLSGDTLPITTRGRLVPGTYEVDAGLSSQFTSGLMFALPLLDGPSRIVPVGEAVSAGYLDITADVLRTFGVEGGFSIPGGARYRSPGEVFVEGDWSNAAFWLSAGVEVTGLRPDSLQPDRRFPELMAAREIDAAQVPDLVPILAVCAAVRERDETLVVNAGRLRGKESDRLESVRAMLAGLGGNAEIAGDSLLIRGQKKLTGGTVDGMGDHRIVMAAAIASCFCTGDIIITGADAVAKSYPGFFKDFNSLGGKADVVIVR